MTRVIGIIIGIVLACISITACGLIEEEVSKKDDKDDNVEEIIVEEIQVEEILTEKIEVEEIR